MPQCVKVAYDSPALTAELYLKSRVCVTVCCTAELLLTTFWDFLSLQQPQVGGS